MDLKRTLLAAAVATATGLTTGLTAGGALAADGEYRIVDDPLTLDIHFHFRDKYVYRDDWPVEKAAAEHTGIKLHNVASLATPMSADAFNLMVASGDIPDIVGGNELKEGFNQYGPEGAFLPLNDLIDEHAPNIKAFFDENPDLRSAIEAADGELYFIPYLPDGEYGRGYFIRMDWLDKLGLEVPETVDELHDVLVAFRDKDPNGNGKRDEIPFFDRDWEEMIRLVTLWDARTSGSDTWHDFYIDDDGKVSHGYSEEVYGRAMKNLAGWYEEKLIDPEIFTRGSSSRDYLLSNDLGGVTHDWFASTAGYNPALEGKIEGFSLKAFAPPASPSGRRIEEHRRTPVKPDGWAIGYTNEHAVETVKYFDFWFTDLGRRLSNFGVEGVHYDMVDGKAIFKPEILESDQSVVSQLYDVGAQIPRGFHQDYAYEEQWTNEIALEGIALYEEGDYLVPQFYGVSLNADEKKVYDKYWRPVETYMLEMQQKWILGNGDPVADWDDYANQLDKRGMKQVLEVMQSAYDRQYGA